MNHLYIQTAFLGDLLLSIPTLKQIRYWSPQSSITLVCRQGLGALMKSLAICDEVIEVDKSSKKALGRQLKGRKFQTVFCPHQSYSSHQLVGEISAEQKIGYSQFWNSRYFDIRVERRLDWPEAIRQLQLLAAVSESIEVNLEAFAQKDKSIPQWAEMTLGNLNWSEERRSESGLEGRLWVGCQSTLYLCCAGERLGNQEMARGFVCKSRNLVGSRKFSNCCSWSSRRKRPL